MTDNTIKPEISLSTIPAPILRIATACWLENMTLVELLRLSRWEPEAREALGYVTGLKQQQLIEAVSWLESYVADGVGITRP